MRTARDEDYDGSEPLVAPEPALLAAVGGAEAVRALTDAFYARVAHNPVLRPLFPRAVQRNAASREHLSSKLARHLTELLGGPASYTDRYGHARMYDRHRPFPIGTAEADEWVREMAAAMDETGMAPQARDALRQLFQEAAHDLINSDHPTGPRADGDPRAAARVAARRKNPLRSRHR